MLAWIIFEAFDWKFVTKHCKWYNNQILHVNVTRDSLQASVCPLFSYECMEAITPDLIYLLVI